MSEINWSNMSMSRHSKTALSELVEENHKLKKENRLLKLTYAKCCDCKHANMYIPDFAFLVMDPKCDLNIKTIHFDSNACEDFTLCGRLGR